MPQQRFAWRGDRASIAYDQPEMRQRLLDVSRPCHVVRCDGRSGISHEGQLVDAATDDGEAELLASVQALPPERLGARSFQADHGCRLSYAAGSMANGIASEELVIAMGQAGLLSSFGAAGLLPNRIAEAIQRVQQALPNGPYAFNLIHSPSEPAIEAAAVELYLQRQIHTVEASAFLDLTLPVVRYRVAGLRTSPDGAIVRGNRIIAKISRREVAAKFLLPPPADMVAELVRQGAVSDEQAALAARVPMCDDLTVEADSGGHTDNRPLVALLPSLIELRSETQAAVRVGAAGGIGTPASALAAFAMGADYVVTGSVNQSCREAAASPHTKGLLAQAGMADVMMAPAADMFEMGVKVQLLKKGTMFPMRAQRLYELYQAYDSLDSIPAAERERLERQLFRQPLGDIWADTARYFQERDPEQLDLAANNPKRQMALVFRWYLGLSSRWSNAGEPGREMDYQVWCGPSMGAFNDWVRGSWLEPAENRSVVDVAHNIVHGAAYLARLNQLRLQGYEPPFDTRFAPQPRPA